METKAGVLAIGMCLAGLAVAGCSRTAVEAPPAPQEEVVAACPGPEYVWIGGRWERPSYPRAEWVRPRWEHRGGHFVLIRGYWR